MGYTKLGKERTPVGKKHAKGGLAEKAVTFIRERCEGLRFDAKKEREGTYSGSSLRENQIPYNMQMDLDRLCLENAIVRFLESGRKEDAFDVYFCYLEMFIGDYDKTRRMIELLSEYEASGSALLMKHRDHYSHSVYVFILGLALYEANEKYQEKYKQYYEKDCHFADEQQAAHHYLQYWGLASLFHDIGYPFELPFEQVCSYFEVEGDKRKERPFVAYHGLEPFVSLDKAMQRKIAEIYELGTDKIISSTDELFAYALHKKLGATYYFSEEEMLGFLRKKPTEPDKFGHYMDHAYFSATVLFKKLFCELGCNLTPAHMDSLTAIILHNSLYKFCVAYYKDERSNIPFKAELHPLAYMLMLCDELQCWDRTAYGRNSKLELHPMDCRFELTEDSIKATYIYDGEKSSKAKIDNFKKEYEEWRENKKIKKPALKAYSGMYTESDGEISAFQKDIERIVDMNGITFIVATEDGARDRKKNQVYLSDSSYLNLYNFAMVLNGRWSQIEAWETAKEENGEEQYLLDESRKKEAAEEFKKLSLEYKLYNINQAKAFAGYLNVIGCFYTDKNVDFDMLESFTEKERDTIGRLEHKRWLQAHYDMGWSYGTCRGDERELRRQHEDMLPDVQPKQEGEWIEVSDEQASEHYDQLDKAEQDKDIAPMECMLAMLRAFDGLRMYRIK